MTARVPVLLLLIVIGAAGLLLFSLGNTADEAAMVESASISDIRIPNQGGDLEGHTPRGFAGMGTGLFVGDNLNQNFPEGDGVQAFLTFDLGGVAAPVSSVRLVSDDVFIRGAPFSDLGSLIVERVTYETFSPALWNVDARGGACILAREPSGSVSCDVTEAVNEAIDMGAKRVQFRVRFTQAGDGDGSPDLVLFYKTNSNTNEAGIFRLELEVEASSDPSATNGRLSVPVVVHAVKESGGVSTKRSREELQRVLARAQEIWDQARIELDVEMRDVTLDSPLAREVTRGNFRALYSLIPEGDLRFHVFYVGSLSGPNGIALPPQVALIADVTTVDDFRATAHELGHLLGLGHTIESRSRLMFPGANGRVLAEEEIVRTREVAKLRN